MAKEKFITGIYNYCDRWCERCYLTSKCRVYASEQAFRNKDIESNTDEENLELWNEIQDSLDNAMEMLNDMAEEFGFDLDEIEEEIEETESLEEKRERIDKHPLIHAAKEYSRNVHKWLQIFEVQYFDELKLIVPNKSEEDLLRIEEAHHILRWYHIQIEIKLKRALSSKDDPHMQDPPKGFPTDSDGSAKVALIGIHRSIGAFEILRKFFPEKYDDILKYIIQLDHLYQFVKEVFPKAENCKRPGFDD